MRSNLILLTCVTALGSNLAVTQALAGGFTVGGAVYTDVDNPLTSGIAGVEVCVSCTGFEECTTTAGGLGLWSVADVPEGTCSVSAALDGYCLNAVSGGRVGDPPPISIDVTAANQAANLSIQFLATPCFTVGGAVYTDLDHPLTSGLAGVEVCLDCSGGFEQCTLTAGGLGLWSVDDVPMDQCTVDATLPGWCLNQVVGGVVGDPPPVPITVDAAHQAANLSIQFLAVDCADDNLCTDDLCEVDSGCIHPLNYDPKTVCCDPATGATFPIAFDINGDGKVDPLDLGILLGSWGPCMKGACCNADGLGGCQQLDQVRCFLEGGSYLGHVTSCLDCPTSCGAGAGDCCTANGTAGCEELVCCNDVCVAHPECCDVEWTADCAMVATTFCDACAGGQWVDESGVHLDQRSDRRTAGAAVFPPCPADFNCDGVVGPSDLAALIGHWGPQP